MKRHTIAAALLSLFVVAPIGAFAQEHDIEQLVIEMANTPAEHQAVARHYRGKADEARAEAKRHEAMGRTYATAKNGRPGGQQHCENIADKFREIAAEYEDLAKLHEEQSRNRGQ